MLKLNFNTDFNVLGTSFHGDVINATKTELIAICGKPEEDDDIREKVQNEWIGEGEDENGDTFPFTIYDWKEYRFYGDDEAIDWHIGALDSIDSSEIRQAMESKLAEYRKENNGKTFEEII